MISYQCDRCQQFFTGTPPSRTNVTVYEHKEQNGAEYYRGLYKLTVAMEVEPVSNVIDICLICWKELKAIMVAKITVE